MKVGQITVDTESREEDLEERWKRDYFNKWEDENFCLRLIKQDKILGIILKVTNITTEEYNKVGKGRSKLNPYIL